MGRRVRKRNKRAQLSQVFVYFLAAIVFAIIFIFGYRAVTEVLDKGERVEFIVFKTQLEKSVRRVAPDYGGVIIFNSDNPLSVPAQYDTICFVDMDKATPDNCDDISELNPVICDAWQTTTEDGAGWEGADANVFLAPAGRVPIKVYRVELVNAVYDNAFLCFDVKTRRLDVRLEGKGDRTLVSKP